MINREWRQANRMPAKATLDQRIAWHLEHAKHCRCRPIAGKILEEMQRRQIPIPKPISDQ